MEKTAERLRAIVANADRSGSGRPYPSALRREVVAYVEARRRQGIGSVAAAREIGVSAFSVARWTSALRADVETGFRDVVLAEPLEAHFGPPRLVVYGPAGLRVEGLDIAVIAALWRSLL
jgi:hypothetical protein